MPVLHRPLTLALLLGTLWLCAWPDGARAEAPERPACPHRIPAGSEESVLEAVRAIVPAEHLGAVASISIERDTIHFDVPFDGGRCAVAARHPACAADGDAAGEALACAVDCDAPAAALGPDLEERCRALASTTIPWKEPRTGLWHWHWYWHGVVQWAGLLLLLLPLGLVLAGRRHLPPIPRRHVHGLAAILVAATVWRFVLPVPGFFREANTARDLLGWTPDQVSVGLYRALAATGLELRPEQVLFGVHALLGWLTIPAAFLATLLLVRSSGGALLTAAFVAFHPLHAKFGVSEALTTTSTYLFATVLLATLWWTGRRSVAALLAGAAIAPLLLYARAEGFVHAGVALSIGVAWGWWRHGPRVAWRPLALGALAAGLAWLTRGEGGPETETTTSTALAMASEHLDQGLEGVVSFDRGVDGILSGIETVLGALVHVDGHPFLDPALVPIPFIALLFLGALVPHRGRLLVPYVGAVLAFGVMFLPYGLVETAVFPLGEGRYQSMLVLPAAWLMALGAVHAARWLGALRERASSAWLRRLLDWRLAVAAVAVNLAWLVPVLRVADYDMPQEHAFAADLAADPALDDAQAIVQGRTDLWAGEYRVYSTSELAHLLTIRLGRPVPFEPPDRIAEDFGHRDLEGVYYFEGIVCQLRPDACAPVRERLMLEPVRTRRITTRQYASRGRYHDAAAHMDQFELTLYRVRGIRSGKDSGR